MLLLDLQASYHVKYGSSMFDPAPTWIVLEDLMPIYLRESSVILFIAFHLNDLSMKLVFRPILD